MPRPKETRADIVEALASAKERLEEAVSSDHVEDTLLENLAGIYGAIDSAITFLQTKEGA